MNRRTFLKYAGAAAVTGAASPIAVGAYQTTKVPVGIGLYTVRGEMANGVEATLSKLAGMGYGEVEFAGYFDHNATDIKRILASTGLAAPSAHVPVEVFEGDFDRALEFAYTVGHKYLILPWLQQHDRTLDRYKSIFDTLNIAGEKAKAAGMAVAYHNHEFEFETVDGEVPYDLLLARTDAALVKLQLDLFWMDVAGQDPVAMINNQPGRVHLVHVKDRTEAGDMVSVGAGKIDFARTFAQSENAGLKHYYVEHDNPEAPMQSAKNSINYLKKTFPRFG
jgi:sugar phosphate isomerase/epimerase